MTQRDCLRRVDAIANHISWVIGHILHGTKPDHLQELTAEDVLKKARELLRFAKAAARANDA